MKVEHITLGGSTVIRDIKDILPETRDFFRPLQAGTVTHKIDMTPFICKITVDKDIAAFDLTVNNNLACTCFCCFGKENREAVLMYAKQITQLINPTAVLAVPKEDHFIISVVVNPLAANPSDFSLAGEIEFYIYDAIYIGMQKRTLSARKSEAKTTPKYLQMQKFEVGQPFPWEQYHKIGDATVPVFNKYSFDVVISFIDPTPEEIKIFHQGKMELGLFCFKDTPFLYLDFGHFSFDFALNINKIDQVEVESWLNSKANAVFLYLVDGSTGILKAQRMISINFLEEIRDILENQTGQTAKETDEIIQEVTCMYTTDQIRQKAIKRMIFK